MAACTMRFNLFSNLRYATAAECEISVEPSEVSRTCASFTMSCFVLHETRASCRRSHAAEMRVLESASEIVTADPKSFPIRKNGAVRQTCARARVLNA